MSYVDDNNTALLLLAYPEISPENRAWIDTFRREHDPLFYGIVEPHITLVFPTFGVSEEDFREEIHRLVQGVTPFDLTLRCAMMNNDRLSEYYHVFLSPDEGNSSIVKLHDRMYSGLLRKTLLLDVDFYSHIGIGSTTDGEECKRLVDAINGEGVEMKGSVRSLDIVSYGNRQLRTLEKITL